MWEICGPENLRTDRGRRHAQFWTRALDGQVDGCQMLEFLRKEGFG
jgi:hypothetical protein